MEQLIENINQKLSSEGKITKFKVDRDSNCFFCNGEMLKDSNGFRAGLFVFERFCSLECVKKALDNNLSNCREYLNLVDRIDFLNKISVLKANQKEK